MVGACWRAWAWARAVGVRGISMGPGQRLCRRAQAWPLPREDHAGLMRPCRGERLVTALTPEVAPQARLP